MPNEKSRKIAGILYFSAKTELCQAMKNYAKYRKSGTINKLVTFITGGVSMVIFFFVFKIIFPEGEAKKATV